LTILGQDLPFLDGRLNLRPGRRDGGAPSDNGKDSEST
jgi:hypothetical protein